MSDYASLLPLMRPVYPERAEQLPDNWLDEYGERYTGALGRALSGWRVRRASIVTRVREHEKNLGKLEIPAIRAAARDLGKSLRR